MAMTADEVEAFLCCCHSITMFQLQQPTYVLDTPHIHTCVQKRQLSVGPSPIIFAPHPRRSPEFNKPVEHFHRHLKKAFRERLLIEVGDRTLEHYWEVLCRCAREVYTYDSVFRDVNDMTATYSNVISKKGDWADRKFR